MSDHDTHFYPEVSSIPEILSIFKSLVNNVKRCQFLPPTGIL